MKKYVGLCIGAALLLASCGGEGVPLTGGTTTTERGESNAINPARNITVVCENTKNQNTGVTVNINNNCNKNNTTTSEAPAE